MFDDLRQFLEKAWELGECKVIEGADWNEEIGLISELQLSRPNQPLLIFDNIKGCETGYRVVTNALNTERRFALAHGLPLDTRRIELVNTWRNRLSKEFIPLSPVEVKTGPIEENVYLKDEVNLLKFPTPKWHSLDGGRYIGTGDIVIMKDLDENWINLGTYRVQVHDKNTITVHIVKSHHGSLIRNKYWAKGLGCPAAIVCGENPLLFSIASSPLCPPGISDYDYIGWLQGKPIEVIKGKTVDLLLPAAAEIVLEGEILPPGSETKDEGPFGEWEGYYGGGVDPDEPILRVNCVMHRNNPIILGEPPMVASFSTYAYANINQAAGIWNELDRQLPGIKGVWCPNETSSPIMTIVSIKQEYVGHAKQVAMAVAGYRGSYLGKYIVIVDEDIDPSNISEVLWALGTRCDPESSIDIIGGFSGLRSDPILPPEKRNRDELVYSRAFIYACKPYTWIKDFPPSIRSSPEALAQAEKKWGKILFKGT